MNKRPMIAIALVLTLAAAGAIYLVSRGEETSRNDGSAAAEKTDGATSTPAAQEDREKASLGVGPHELTIRNVTKKPVVYTLRAYGSEAKAVERTLAPDEIDRYPAPQIVVVSYLKYGREVTYSLYPGKPYSFRPDRAGNIDIWVGAHGREDAVDLAPYVPTPPEVLVKMCELGNVTKDSVVYDIGCGDGRTGRAASGSTSNPNGSANPRPMPRRPKWRNWSNSSKPTPPKWISPKRPS
jgi:hypothetical protein